MTDISTGIGVAVWRPVPEGKMFRTPDGQLKPCVVRAQDREPNDRDKKSLEVDDLVAMALK